MNLNDYIKDKGWKPLTPAELSKGKSHLRIYGTQNPMPWATIFARIESGQPLDEIGKQYGHARKIALFALLNNVEVNPDYQKVIEDEVASRKQIQQIANTQDPEVALTLLQRVNEVAPDTERDIALLGSKFIKAISDKLDDKYIEASDIKSLADAYQKTTDTIGVTQRHSSAVNINTGDNHIAGFTFMSVDRAPTAQYSIEELDAMTIEGEVLTPSNETEPSLRAAKDTDGN